MNYHSLAKVFALSPAASLHVLVRSALKQTDPCDMTPDTSLPPGLQPHIKSIYWMKLPVTL